MLLLPLPLCLTMSAAHARSHAYSPARSRTLVTSRRYLLDANHTRSCTHTACPLQAEVNSIDFNLIVKDTFASASWDGTLRVWRPERPQSVLTLAEHSHVAVTPGPITNHHFTPTPTPTPAPTLTLTYPFTLTLTRFTPARLPLPLPPFYLPNTYLLSACTHTRSLRLLILLTCSVRSHLDVSDITTDTTHYL